MKIDNNSNVPHPIIQKTWVSEMKVSRFLPWYGYNTGCPVYNCRLVVERWIVWKHNAGVSDLIPSEAKFLFNEWQVRCNNLFLSYNLLQWLIFKAHHKTKHQKEQKSYSSLKYFIHLSALCSCNFPDLKQMGKDTGCFKNCGHYCIILFPRCLWPKSMVLWLFFF
jgi:hypothetical protein